MGFIVRDCQRCGTSKVQMQLRGYNTSDARNYELFVVCNECHRGSIYEGQPNGEFSENRNLENHRYISDVPVQIHPSVPNLSEDIPERTRDLFRQAATCRRYGLNEPAGAMFRKTVDVATKQIYEVDQRLRERSPANALRSRIKALGELKILDDEIVELADIAALDGNDAAHDEDPYTAGEAGALEDLTLDLLDRLFVRPANIARVKSKQIASGLRKAASDSET